uniref:Uncharacterized protein n=1 Tax=Syphacia muris TaxID=451379 RepID=A0A0N5AHK8_9BILA
MKLLGNIHFAFGMRIRSTCTGQSSGTATINRMPKRNLHSTNVQIPEYDDEWGVLRNVDRLLLHTNRRIQLKRFLNVFFIRRSEAYRNSYRRTPLQNKVSSARLSPSAAVIVAQQKKEKKSSGKSVNANLNLAEFTTIDRETGLPIKKSVEDAPVSRRDAVIRKNLQRFPFWKLSVNVATFAVFNLLHVLFTLFIMFKEGCYYQWHLETMIPLVYSAKTMTSCRIALDAILAFVVDEQLHNVT